MLKHYLLGSAFIVASATAFAQAQTTPPATPQPAPAAQQPAPAAPQSVASEKNATIVLSGCLVREQDVPGRSPNVAERAGVMEDYILTEAKASSERPAAGTPGAVGTSGSTQNISRMYKVEGIPDEKLKALAGKHVEVTGRVDADDSREVSPAAPAGAATPRSPSADMPEFEATAIRETQGTCPPAAR